MKTFRILIAMAVLTLASKASGQTVTILWSFTGTDGNTPYAGLVQGTDGNFYGTAENGGTSTNCDGGCGTVFRISPSGSLTNLYSFNDPAGDYPVAGLVEGTDGNFYGTTQSGQNTTDGTVFRISSSGSLTTLHQFNGSDGSGPNAGLVQGSDGYFYGTTALGGTNGNGTVFRITPSGVLTNLHSFNGNDGSYPLALVQGNDGNFYGTTIFGGMSSNCNGGCGVVFRISPSGNFTNLYSFSGGDGSWFKSMVQGPDGNFYGTAEFGGPGNFGVVFRISPNGSLTNLYSFKNSSTDGNSPSGLVLGSDGNFYGTALNDSIFRISSSGDFTTLYWFCVPYCNGGVGPNAGLVQGIDGNFYGTTSSGGTSFDGTVFKLVVPLNPPPNQISGVRPSGNDIVFTIPSVAYETYQLQFSLSMNPTDWSNVVGVCVSNSIGAALTVTNFAGTTGPQGFYRFAITP